MGKKTEPFLPLAIISYHFQTMQKSNKQDSRERTMQYFKYVFQDLFSNRK